MKTIQLILIICFMQLNIIMLNAADTYSIGSPYEIDLMEGAYINGMHKTYNIDLNTSSYVTFDYFIDIEGGSYDYAIIYEIDNSGNAIPILEVGTNNGISGLACGRITTNYKNGKAKVLFVSDGSISYQDGDPFDGASIIIGEKSDLAPINYGILDPRGQIDLGTLLGYKHGLKIGDFLEINELEFMNNAAVIGFNTMMDSDGTYRSQYERYVTNRFKPIYSGETGASGMLLKMHAGGIADLEFVGIIWGTDDSQKTIDDFNTVLRLNTDGSVGVGTTPSGAEKFQVKGRTLFEDDVRIGTSAAPKNLYVRNKIEANEIVVTEALTADFVFEEDYVLQNLDEIAKFIKENKHLPGIPSAEQMKLDGLSIAKMDQLLLQKIEELTLYMIELKKENQELRNLIK